jgi:hypothetical protein
MAVAVPAGSDESASRLTFRTIGSVFLLAFVAASVAFYVRTTHATSEDNPRDMLPGYVVNVSTTCVLPAAFKHSQLALQTPSEAISMDQNGVGTLTSADNAALSKRLVSQRQRGATAAAARLRGISQSTTGRSAQQAAVSSKPALAKAGENRARKTAAIRKQQKLVSRRIKQTKASKHQALLDAKTKAAQQLLAHRRLSDHSSQRLTNFPRPSVVAARDAAIKHATAKAISAKAVHHMEDRIATDLVKAFKCTIGTDCLEHNLIDAEKAADKLFYKGSASSVQHQKAASALHNMGATIKNSKIIQSTRAPSSALGASNSFWKEAAKIAENGPEAVRRPTKNSAKTFVKQLAAAHDATRATAEAVAVPDITKGPMTSSKSKVFE